MQKLYSEKKNLRCLSLFSGCGGMDIGFEGGFTCNKKSINTYIHSNWIESETEDSFLVKHTVFDTVFANDIRPDAKAAWVSYFKNYKKNASEIYHVESIVNLVKLAKEGKYKFPENISVVTGGFPCQDFSVAGKRLGFESQTSHTGKKIIGEKPSEDNRGKLYMWMREVISLTEPKVFIAENVKGLTNLNDVKKIIENDFSQAGGGYLVVPAKILVAADYGVPQSRERVIFFGFKKSALTKNALKELSKESISPEFDPYPQTTHGNGENLLPFVTCQDIFENLPEPENSNDISHQKYSLAKYMGKHCQGQTEIRLDSVAPTIRSEHHGNIEFRRLSKDHGGIHYKELENGLKERRLSVRECAMIQTFPNSYQFIQKKQDGLVSVSSSDAYKIIGNAVPCVMAYNIAKNLEAKWEKYFGENIC